MSCTSVIRPSRRSLPLRIRLLQDTWRQVAPTLPFESYFLDEDFNRQYQVEERWSQLIRYASLFTILIAALGLFGLAAIIAERRTKEIGIRKVLGARVSSIVLLLSKDFARLVLIGFALSCPFSYWAASRWLEDFAYRIHVGPGVFVLAGVLALAVALLTVSYQSIKAALADPVRSLRYE